MFAEHVYQTWKKQGVGKPLKVVKAEGCYFYDSNGKRYFDMSSQLMCSNLGHQNKAVIEAIKKQAEKLMYIAPSFDCDIKEEAVKALLEVMPEGLNKFFFSTSGTEANEAAIKMTRTYKFPKYKIISRYHSYHGSTASSISITGDPRRYFAEHARCTIDGIIFAPDPYCYRCPFGKEYPKCDVECARYIEYMIKNEGHVAGFIFEPVVGTNGIIVPPKEYYDIVKEIAEKWDILLIADEVMSGWGRTGEWFAVNHWNLKPDIITTAKGSTGAYMPLGITATTQEIYEFFEEHFFAHGHTYSDHPMSLAPIPAVVSEYKRLNLLEHVKKMEKFISKRLNEMKEEHKSIGDVRGIGMFWAIEFVKNRETKEPFTTRKDFMDGKPSIVGELSKAAMERGVYVIGPGWGNHLIIAPPLIATEKELDEAFDVLDEVIEMADKMAEG